MGGRKQFVDKLQGVFDKGWYDPANEPDIAYPYLFSYFPGEEWRTQKLVKELLERYFSDRPDGLPGNDDTGTMSAWAIFSMLGFYPDCPASPEYTLTAPVFDKVTIQLDNRYYKKRQLVIRTSRPGTQANYIQEMKLAGKRYDAFRISHEKLLNAGEIEFILSEKVKK